MCVDVSLHNKFAHGLYVCCTYSSFFFFPWHALCSIMFEHQRQYNMACCAAVEFGLGRMSSE